MATTTASGKFARTLKRLVGAGILIGVSVGLTLFLQDKIQLKAANADTAETKPVSVPDPLFTSLEPFTVSLRDSHGSRVLYVGITLRVEDEASRKMLHNYMPEVRDRVLRTLTQQSTTQVQAPDGREVLASQLQRALTRPYQPNPQGPLITRVLFTAYVVQ